MKTIIIATIVAVGLSLRPQAPSTLDNLQLTSRSIDPISVTVPLDPPSRLDSQQLSQVVGNGLFTCEWLIEDGVVWGRCCAGFWIFKVCGYIEVGPLPPTTQK